MKGKFRKVDLRENNREGRLFYREETKSNRAEKVSFGAIRFDLRAIRFAAKALRFPFVGPRLQRDHRRNLREGFAFDFGAMSRRSCRFALELACKICTGFTDSKCKFSRLLRS